MERLQQMMQAELGMKMAHRLGDVRAFSTMSENYAQAAWDLVGRFQYPAAEQLMKDFSDAPEFWHGLERAARQHLGRAAA